jgi:hypothetical protein
MHWRWEVSEDLEHLFDIAMMNIYHRAWDEANYKASRFFSNVLRDNGEPLNSKHSELLTKTTQS